MRELTGKEKELINNLIEYYQPTGTVTIGNVLLKTHKIECLKRITPQEGEKSAEGIIDSRKVKIIYYRYEKIDFVSDLYESLALLEFLITNRYIILNRQFEQNIIGDDSEMLSPIKRNRDGIPDSFDLLNNFGIDTWTLLSSYFVVTNSLFDFAKDFKTPKQRRFTSQQIATWVGIGVSFLIGIAGVMLNICGLEKDTNITKTQFEELKQIIQQTKSEIPETINIAITNDTLNVNTVNKINKKE